MPAHLDVRCASGTLNARKLSSTLVLLSDDLKDTSFVKTGTASCCHITFRGTMSSPAGSRSPRRRAGVRGRAVGLQAARRFRRSQPLARTAPVQGSTDRSPQTTDGTALATRTIRPDAFARIRTTCTPAYSAPCRESLLVRTWRGCVLLHRLRRELAAPSTARAIGRVWRLGWVGSSFHQ